MAYHGAYGADQVYTKNQVKQLVHYANQRGMQYLMGIMKDDMLILIPGVRIVPEFDAPSHVGLGWQFPDVEQFTVCISKEPW